MADLPLRNEQSRSGDASPRATACSVDIWSPHLLEADGLAGILSEAGCSVPVIASNLESGCASLARRRPDVILLDACFVGDSLSTLRLLQEQGHNVVVLIGQERGGPFIQSVMAAGAKGCLSCDEEPARFADCVKMVAKGAVVISANAAMLMAAAPLTAEQLSEAGKLSERERQIAHMVARGATNREIGEALFLSEHTVKIHLGHVLEKLHLRNRQQLAAYIADRELLPDVRLE